MCRETKNEATEVSILRSRLKRGQLQGALSVGLLMLAYSIAMPFQQSRRDELGCDSMCLGTLMSARSTVTLVGATVIGRLSDAQSLNHYGGARRLGLWIGLAAAGAGLVMANRASTVRQLFYSILPEAFQQNMHIVKALMSEYQDAIPGEVTVGERAASAGSIGMAVGLAMMLGPSLSAHLLSNYDQATNVALLCLAASAALVYTFPQTNKKERKKEVEHSSSSYFGSLFVSPHLRSPATIYILVLRVLFTQSYHIYQTISSPSLRQRFDFGPKQYGTFLSVVGFFFALSQGVFARIVLDRFGKTHRTRIQLIIISCSLIAVTRYFAFYTTDLLSLYLYFGVMVTAYGVQSTIIAADTSQLAAQTAEAGTFFGVLAAVESSSGMAGPLIGGALSKVHGAGGALVASIALNAVAVAFMAFGYESWVVTQLEGGKSPKKDD
jgi:DHA1 family tetracycline resistance protein-like MFS transporter